MAVALRLDLDDLPALSGIDWAVEQLRDLTDLMDQIGRVLVGGANERIAVSNEGPDGQPWAPSKRVREGGGKTLLLSGLLRMSITAQPAADHVLVGTNVPYAGVHQGGAAQGAFGTRTGWTSPTATRPKSQFFLMQMPWGDIPARPFIGVSDGERQDIEDLTILHVSTALGGGAR